ncbi:MAG: nucleoside triphosphate pyrophosphohydrolase [Synechococcus sp. SupBloom_Metag_053]|nr:nucleoside triphosphate pyrophosphohydrolase [Synechococcus sp. SupBloom_Metag_053]
MVEAFKKLIAVVAKLRDPESGCPWDLKQTHSSLIPYVLEEAHELVDAIRYSTDQHLAEELGDLLLQVVLHAQIAKERDAFDLEQVIETISAKLVRRHPHVFNPEVPALSWEEIKAEEQRARGETQVGLAAELQRKIRSQPAMAAAMLISKKAAAAGFEWPDLDGVWAKVEEELQELKEAVGSGNKKHSQEELGDLLFTLVNLGRWCELNPEAALDGTNHRFLDRFARVEAALDGELKQRSSAELEEQWQQAKAEIKALNPPV